MARAQVDKSIIGKKYGKLTVLDKYRKNNQNNTDWLCKCDCGNEVFVYRGHLTSGHTQSCGCIKLTRDGNHSERLYKIWWSMLERCHNPECESFKNYGARGIVVKESFLSFDDFYKWSRNNGYSEDLTIDRIKSSGNYEPSNCQWITLSENVAKSNKENHRRKSKFIYFGISPSGEYYEFKNAAEFSKEYDLDSCKITYVANGKRKSHKGWRFGFTDRLNK